MCILVSNKFIKSNEEVLKKIKIKNIIQKIAPLLWDGLEADLEAADRGCRGLVLNLGQPRLVGHMLAPPLLPPSPATRLLQIYTFINIVSRFPS